MKTETIPTELKQAIEIIKQKANPIRIILFGSRARGENKASSDYDIFIITRNVRNEREITRSIYKEMYKSGITLDIELIALNEDRWQNAKNRFGLIYKQIDSEGIELYSE